MLRGKLVLCIILVLFAVAVLAKDYYKILGVNRDATEKDIKKAFRKLSIKYHPDRAGNDPEAQAKFLEINEAHEVLSNKEKRQIYDMDGIEGLKQAEQRANSPFGGHRPKGPNIMVNLRVSLEQLYKGQEASIDIKRNVLCPACRGSGAKDGERVKCDVCKGRGYNVVIQEFMNMRMQMQQPCHACGGKGHKPKHVCPRCNGARVVSERKTLVAMIERGMKDGATIVFEGEAEQHPDPNIMPGDVIAVVREVPHPIFTRDGDDLKMDMEISLREALLGFTRTIVHLDGHKVTIQNKPGHTTQPFEVQVIEGEGMPLHGTPSLKGNLHVKFIVKFPDSLSPSQQTAIKELLQPQ